MRTKHILWVVSIILLAGAAWYATSEREWFVAELSEKNQMARSHDAMQGPAQNIGEQLQRGDIESTSGAPDQAVPDGSRTATGRVDTLSDQEEIDRALTILDENPELLGDDARDYAALLEEEKRDELWASSVESGIATQIAGLQALGGNSLQVPYVRCGSTVCEVRAVNYPVAPTSPYEWQNVAGRFSSGDFGPQLFHATTTGMPASDKKRIVYITYLRR